MAASKSVSFPIRQTQREHLEWERLAAERGVTVSDLIRQAVTAYTKGDYGAPFAERCSYRERHQAGFRCVMCGGVR